MPSEFEGEVVSDGGIEETPVELPGAVSETVAEPVSSDGLLVEPQPDPSVEPPKEPYPAPAAEEPAPVVDPAPEPETEPAPDYSEVVPVAEQEPAASIPEPIVEEPSAAEPAVAEPEPATDDFELISDIAGRKVEAMTIHGLGVLLLITTSAGVATHFVPGAAMYPVAGGGRSVTKKTI